MLFLDWVYGECSDDLARFRWVKAPNAAGLAQLAHPIARCVGRFLERWKLLERDAENSYLAVDAAPMAQLLGHSTTFRFSH